MNKSQWVKITGRILRLWPHQTIPDDALAEWYLLLADLDAEAVNAAVTPLAISGREFAPPVGVIRAKVLELSRPGVTFEQVWAEIDRCISAFGSYCEEAALQALRPVPLAIELVTAMGGWRQVCLGGPDECKATDPGVWRSQAEHAFKALAQQQRGDLTVAGLPGPHADLARKRLTAGWQRLADIAGASAQPPNLPQNGEGTQRPQSGRQRLALPPQSGNGLKPELRAEIERMIRDGKEAEVPERWRCMVNPRAVSSTGALSFTRD